MFKVYSLVLILSAIVLGLGASSAYASSWPWSHHGQPYHGQSRHSAHHATKHHNPHNGTRGRRT
jgi:hypothetical protein